MTSHLNPIAVDAHAHVWDRALVPQPWIDPESMAAIDRDFSLADLAAMREANNVAATVLVQSAHDRAETEALCAAVDHETVLGAVGWVDLTGDVPGQLAYLDETFPGALVGIRHLAHQDPNPQVLLSAGLAGGIDELGRAGKTMDLVVQADQLPQASQVAAAHPNTFFVLDHMGNPPLDSEAGLASWRTAFLDLAGLSNAAVKVSGIAMGAPEQWSPADLRPVVELALEKFGTGRLMVGSDWPVVRLRGDAPKYFAALAELTGELSQAEREALYGETASKVYGLGSDSGRTGTGSSTGGGTR